MVVDLEILVRVVSTLGVFLLMKSKAFAAKLAMVVVVVGRRRCTTKKSRFNIGSLTSVLDKTDVNLNMVAYL